MAAKKLILRGAEFRTVKMDVNGSGCAVTCELICDITEPLAREMGWEIYQITRDEEGKPLHCHLSGGLIGSTPLEGELYLESVALEISGADGLEKCAATTADQFKLTRAKADDGDGVETTLRFRLMSTAWETITRYFGLMGQANGRLTLQRLPEQTKLQRNLGEDEGDAEDAEDQEEPGGEPEPAETPKRRGRTKKGTAASTITMEAVQ